MPDDDRSDITFEFIKPARQALDALSKQKPSPILAKMMVFADDWKSGLSQEAIHSRYNFKQVGSDSKCKQHGNLFQIYVTRKYRALLTFVDSERSWYWLDVFVKNPTSQNTHIKTACDRALRLQERKQT